jgi:acyl-CoA synthetase (AMP-forming)/AMP-acid ligase II
VVDLQNEMYTKQHLTEVLSGHAESMSDEIAFTFVSKGGRTLENISYGRLHQEACDLSALLQSNLEPGERAVLMYPAGLDFIKAFLGCLYAEVIAVPVYPPHPAQPDKAIRRALSIIRDCGARVILMISVF